MGAGEIGQKRNSVGDRGKGRREEGISRQVT